MKIYPVIYTDKFGDQAISNTILEPLNQSVFNMVDYINYWQTPFVKKDFAEDIVLHLEKLDYHEYLISRNTEEIIQIAALSVALGEGAQELQDSNSNTLVVPYSHAKVGYYINNYRFIPFNNDNIRAMQFDPSHFLFVPFSNGSYYDVYTIGNKVYFVHTPEATYKYGTLQHIYLLNSAGRYYNIKNKFIKGNNIQRITLSNFIIDTSSSIPSVQDAIITNIESTNPNEKYRYNSVYNTLLSEIFYEDEELIIDHSFQLTTAELQNQKNINYTIVTNNSEQLKFPANGDIHIEVF